MKPSCTLSACAEGTRREGQADDRPAFGTDGSADALIATTMPVGRAAAYFTLKLFQAVAAAVLAAVGAIVVWMR